MSETPSDLERRLASLERKNRVLASAVLGLLALTLVAATSAPGPAPTPGAPPLPLEPLRARALEIVGEDGVVRARLASADTGGALALFDAAGNARLTLTVQAAGPEIALRDPTGVVRASLAHLENATGLYIRDAAANTRLAAALFPRGSGLTLSGAEMRGAVALSHLEGVGKLVFYDPSGNASYNVPPAPAPAK